MLAAVKARRGRRLGRNHWKAAKRHERMWRGAGACWRHLAARGRDARIAGAGGRMSGVTAHQRRGDVV